MKLSILFLALLLTLNAFSHDEGHGPALKDESVHGGKITAIILENEVKLGRKAKMLLKGELVHSARELGVKLYLFSDSMKPIDLKEFSTEVQAVQIERNKESTFKLTLDKSGKFYAGIRPKNKRVPFNIDVRMTKSDSKLFGAFDGLD